MNQKIIEEYGTNRLLKQGAVLVTHPKEIIESFCNLKYCKEKEKIIIIPEKYKEIYNMIKRNKIDANAIARKQTEPIQKILDILLLMEIEDYIEKLPDGRYKIKGDK